MNIDFETWWEQYGDSKTGNQIPEHFAKLIWDAGRHEADFRCMDKMAEEIKALHEQLDSAIKGVLCIRCAKHYNVAQQNHNEHSGGECGACIAAERNTLRTACEIARNALSEIADVDTQNRAGWAFKSVLEALEATKR